MDICIDCDGRGKYPSKARCISCGGSGRVLPGDGIAVANRRPRPDLSTVAKRNAFYRSEEYRNMTTAEKCAVQGDGFINDYD